MKSIIFALITLLFIGCYSPLPTHKSYTETYTHAGRHSDITVLRYDYPDSSAVLVYKRFHRSNGYLLIDYYVDYRR